jgi:hypothetical protein
VALSKTLVPVSFSQGIDTKTDQKQVVFGKLLTLQHANFTSPGQLTKASGYVQLQQTILGDLTHTIVNCQGLMSLNNELLMASNNKLYSFSSANQSWAQKGSILSTIVGGVSINRDAANDTNPDSALAKNGLQVFAWEETAGVRYSVLDTNTNQLIVSSKSALIGGVTDGGQKPKCLALGNFLFVLWVDSTGTVLSCIPIPLTTPQSAGLSIQLATGLSPAAPTYDACLAPGGVSIFYAFNNTVANQIGVGLLGNQTSPLTAVSSTVATSIGSGAALIGGIACMPSISDNSVCVGFVTSSTSRALLVNPVSLLLLKADFVVHAITGLINLSGIYDGANGLLSTYQSFGTTPAYNNVLWTSQYTGVTVTGTPTAVAGYPKVLMRSVSLVGKPFRFTNANYTADYVLVQYVSGNNGIQNTYFVVDSTGVLVAKVLANQAGGLNSNHHVAESNLLSAAQNVNGFPQTGPTYQWAVTVQDLLTTNVSIASQAGQSASAALFSQQGVDSATVQFFAATASYDNAQISNALHIVGGYLATYDSANVVESGFHLWPESVVVSGVTAGANTYSVIAVYEWTDAQGNRYQSAPSLATQFTSAALNGTNTATYTTTACRVTQKTGVVVAFYRTDYVGSAAGTQFYRCSPNTSPVNNPAQDTVAFTDTSADPVGSVPGIAAGQNLYTFGGVVENVAPPGVVVSDTFANRLWLLSSRNRLQVWYSKQVVPGTPPQFSDLFILNMDPRGGDIVAMESMDANQVFFKKNVIFAIQGDGPDDTGQQNTFSTPQLVSTDTGCTSPQSTVLTPMGIMYKSTKGIYLLDRSLAASYIGADVEFWNQYDVVSADLVSRFNQVRYNMTNGDQLVYDYYMKTWSTRPLLSLIDSAILDTQYFYCDSLGRVMADEPGVFTIANQPYSMLATTSWLAMAGVAGLQRVYGMMLTGTFQSPHTLKVSIAYDYNPIPSQIVNINAEAFDPGFWGDGTNWGSDSVWGGLYPSYQFRINFAIQKCTAVQITIQDNEGGVNNINGVPVTGGQGYSLSNFTFIVGVKEGWKKVGIERVFS